MEPWRLVDQRPVPAGYISIVTRQYELPGGGEAEWDLLAGGDTVAVLAMTADRHVVLVRQYRPGPARILDELPGGGIEEGEDPAEAAARELAEETGYAGEVEVVGSTWLAGNAFRRRWATVALDCVQRAAPSPDASLERSKTTDSWRRNLSSVTFRRGG